MTQQKTLTPETSTPDTASSPTTGLQDFWMVLHNPNFLILWSGQVFSQLADKVSLVLMIKVITSQFQAEGQSISGWVSAIMIAFTLPAILFGSVAGIYVDRWSKRGVLIGSNLLRGALLLLIPLLLWVTHDGVMFTIPLGFVALLGITFSVSTLTQYFAPAEQSAIPLIVPKSLLLSANSLYTTTMMASVIIGFAIGDPLLTLANHGLRSVLADSHPGMTNLGATLAVGGAYLLAGLILTRLSLQEASHTPGKQPSLWSDLKVGLQFLGQSPAVRAALVQLVTLFSIFAALAVLAVRMAELIPTLQSSQFGVLLAAAGVGLGIGAFWTGFQGNRVSRRQWTLIGSWILALTLALMALFPQQLSLVLVLIGVVGIAGACVGIPMQTVIQEETPESLRGKVFGLQNNVTNIALSLPLVVAGVAETYWGLAPVLLSLAVITASVGLLTWTIAGQTFNSTRAL